MAVATGQWDAAAVVGRAKELIHASNYEKVAEARRGVDDTLAQWEREALALPEAGEVRERAVACLIELWSCYAQLEVELRQFKQATKVFEAAVSATASGASTRLWLEYAAFCIDRKKFSNARKVFMRAVHAVQEVEREEVWQHFHEFAVAHIDPTISLDALRSQVMLIQVAPPSTGNPTPTASPSNAVATAKPMPTAVTTPAAPETMVTVDPALAFVDKTGQPTPTAIKRENGAVDTLTEPPTAAKRAKREETPAPAAAMSPKSVAGPLPAPSKYFLHIPQTLPFIPECPNLLFDTLSEGERQQNLPNDLLERLSEVLGDSAVFKGVRDMFDSQRQHDREMLYRWQDVVGMQMKEGSELFARHTEAELQQGFADARGLIELKTAHLEQRREFVSRCQMSQQQFIEICAMDRTNTLRAQQASLENMKIPEMSVTMDSGHIQKQRAIVGLILDAEKLWREENASGQAGGKSKETAIGKGNSSPAASVGRRQRRDSQDSTSSHSTTRSTGSNHRGAPRGGRGGFRRDNRANGPIPGRRRDRDPRRAAYDPRGGPSKWDGGPHPANSSALYEAPPPSRMQEPYPAVYQRTQPHAQQPMAMQQQQQQQQQQQHPPHMHRQAEQQHFYQQHPQQQHPQQQQPPQQRYARPVADTYDAYGRPEPVQRYPQTAAPAYRAADAYEPRQDMMRGRRDVDRFGGQPDWQLQQPPPQQQPPPRQGYGAHPEADYRPAPIARYGGPAAAPQAYGADPRAGIMHQQQQQQHQYGGMRDQAPPSYEGYAAYDYPPQQQAPPQASDGYGGFDPRGGRGGRGGGRGYGQRDRYGSGGGGFGRDRPRRGRMGMGPGRR